MDITTSSSNVSSLTSSSSSVAPIGSSHESKQRKIAMLSDFFFPNTGGVEMHLYQLSTCLIKRGNKVIMITHSYGYRKGVRYLTNGLKVYYIPQNQFYNQSSLPTLVFSMYLPIIRKILIREQIDIVHGHQAFSTMALEGMLHARTMGYKTCFTDHSLFGFADASSIHTNKLLKFSLSDAGHVICVSHTSKENTVLRASLDPMDVSVIPNAIDATKFTPHIGDRDNSILRIVIVSRLVYRKGVDLMIEVIPAICHQYPNVVFVIGGDGPMTIDLEEMIEKHGLQDRVEMLGAVPHHKVRDVLAAGHIFLNCSLTEAFCIAIVEAVSCGLLCVSTRVGGVPEVLPPDMIKLAEPNGEDLIEKVKEAIVDAPLFDRFSAHERVKSMYSWFEVAERTEIVYDRLLQEERIPLIERLRRFYACGLWAGKIFCIIVGLAYLYWQLLEWWTPSRKIEIAPNFSSSKYQQYLRNQTKPQQNELFGLEAASPSGHTRRPSRTLGRSVAASMEVLWEEMADMDEIRTPTPAPAGVSLSTNSTPREQSDAPQ